MDYTTYLDTQFTVEQQTSLHSNLLSEVSTPRFIAPELFHKEITPSIKATNQKSSGRCWMFAGLNTIRRSVMKEHNLPNDFEFSQSYLFFWDKFERMNFYIKTLNEWKNNELSLNDRVVNYLLKDAFGDGGQWSMFVNLVNKYGLVPKRNYPESTHSSNSRGVNMVLTRMLRNYASELFSGSSPDKDTLLKKTFEILVRFFGKPPMNFVFEYMKDKQVTSIEFTPQRFRDDFCKVSLDDYVVLLNDPRHEYNKLFTVEYLNNMEGGTEVKYLNLNMDRCRDITKKALDDNQPVWFGSDVGQFFHRNLDMLDEKVFDYLSFLDIKDTMTKKDRVETGESIPSHAMVYVGYHKDNYGQIDYWKIENSWGNRGNYSGHLVCSDKWFKEYTFNLVLPKKYLSQEEKEIWNSNEFSAKFPLWDPMGTLA